MVYDEMKRVEVAEQRLAAARAEAVKRFVEYCDANDATILIEGDYEESAITYSNRYLASLAGKEPSK